MDRLLKNAVQLSHKFIAEVVRKGSTVVDATVGNGGDTLFLADLVGAQGLVIGFDLQKEALEKAERRLREAGLCERVKLVNFGHETMKEHVEGAITACMFNLGYLPGSSHDLITLPGTTKLALCQAMDMLQTGGLITLVVYTGHEGGAEEAALMEEIVAALPQEEWDAATIQFPNRRNHPPYLIIIQKR